MGLRGDADVAEVPGRGPGREVQAAKERRRQVTGVAADPGPLLVDVIVPTRVHSGRLKKSSNRKKHGTSPRTHGSMEYKNRAGRIGASLMDMRLGATAVDGIQTLFNYGTMVGSHDDCLVAQLRSGQEGSEAALRVLIYRHGPMVMGICRRILGDEHAAEDAFQATFLVLLRKAGTLRDRDLLANWLHGVARRVATKEKAKAVRRRLVERRAGGASGLNPTTWGSPSCGRSSTRRSGDSRSGIASP